MSKMGYEPGKGLGKDGAGRVQPVPIQLLPQGGLFYLHQYNGPHITEIP